MRLRSLWIVLAVVVAACVRSVLECAQAPALQHPKATLKDFHLAQALAGVLTGTATDPSGAVIPGVKVILDAPGFAEKTTTTSADGTYRFTNLPARSDYRLRFLVPGFSTLLRQNVAVSLNASTRIDVRMRLQTAAAKLPKVQPPPPPPPPPVITPKPGATAPEPVTAAPPPPSEMPPPAPAESPPAAVAPPPSVTPAAPAEAPAAAAPDWDAIVAQEVGKLREGKIAFNPPARMKQGQRERIEARISAQDIGSALTEGLKGSGLPSVGPVKVGATMKVSLTAESGAFELTALSDEEQTVAGKPFAQWDWDVTPLKSGDHWLHLRVVAPIYVPGRGEKAYDFPAIDRSIDVQVDRWYASKNFLQNYWQWIFGTLLLPLIAWGWKLYADKK